jgi:uncharacterized membrane protein
MLVVFSLGLWIFSVISDFIFLLGVDAGWNDVAFYTLWQAGYQGTRGEVESVPPCQVIDGCK